MVVVFENNDELKWFLYAEKIYVPINQSPYGGLPVERILSRVFKLSDLLWTGHVSMLEITSTVAVGS